MNDEKNNRTKMIRVRLTAEELRNINQKLEQSSSKNVSEYVRKKILDKPIVIYQRNKSLDEFIREMVMLRKELNAVGHNYNQVVKRLHSMYDYSEIKHWLLNHEANWKLMQKKVDEIHARITQINQQWLR